MALSLGGISASGRGELANVLSAAGAFVTPDHVVTALGIDDRRVAAQKLARWAREGWLRRVRRGLYIPVPVDARDPAAWAEAGMAVATEVWSPCYFTGWTAASHWGLSEQVFRTIVLKSVRRVRNGHAELLDQDYLITHISEEDTSWGMKTVWNDDVRTRIADPARAVIDLLDAPRLGGGIRNTADILRAYLADHDAAPLIEYGDRLGNRTVFKRLGYLAEALGFDEPHLRDACQERLSAGISLLDPDAPEQGSRSMRWRVRANVRVDRVDAS
jgi:predicted transcriptional regulator of viral defense system